MNIISIFLKDQAVAAAIDDGLIALGISLTDHCGCGRIGLKAQRKSFLDQ